MSDPLPAPSRVEFTIAQRRRAEALLWARLVLPGVVGPDLTFRVAQWIATGTPPNPSQPA